VLIVKEFKLLRTNTYEGVDSRELTQIESDKTRQNAVFFLQVFILNCLLDFFCTEALRGVGGGGNEKTASGEWEKICFLQTEQLAGM
jgi:hypothetical protein